jgi:tetratricopeptide (TPR) repeat protein
MLRARLARAAHGEGDLVLLSGEPGAGKTRLVRELAREATEGGVLVCYGASDAAVRVPYQPLQEWLEFVLRVCEHDAVARCVGEDGQLLARLMPAFAKFDTGTEPVDNEPAMDRYQLQTAVVEVLRRLGERKPMLLIAEDIHWSDSETLGLLVRLARAAPAARMLVVASFRRPGAEIKGELADALAELVRLDGVTQLALGGLSAEDVDTFVRESTDDEASSELVAAISELTDGTPLLLCELWRELVARGAVESTDGRLQLVGPPSQIRGSERIGILVMQRLSRLSTDTAALLELAAVIGPRFELEVLADAAGRRQRELAGFVDIGVESGIVEELPGRVPTCRFTHELVRRAVYDRITGVRRIELHLCVGEALERAHGSEPARVLNELAYHFSLAAPLAGPERAVDYNVRAARASAGASAYAEAAARLSTALELGVRDPQERVRLQVELGSALWETGRIAEAEALLAATRDAATGLAERGLAERALVHSVASRLFSDPALSSAEVVPIAERAIETFHALADALGLAEAEYLLAEALDREGRWEEGRTARERALAHAEAAGATALRRSMIDRLAASHCLGWSPVEDAIARIEELISSTRDDPVPHMLLGCHLALALAMAGRFGDARAQLAAGAAGLREAGETNAAWSSRVSAVEAMQLLGDDEAAEREMTTVFLHFRGTRGEGTEARALQFGGRLALLCCDQGRWQEAADWLAYGQEVDRSPPVYGKAYAEIRLVARARVAAQLGETGEAVVLARAAIEAADRRDTPNGRARAWLALAEVQRVAGNTAEADAALARAIELFERKGNVGALHRLRAPERAAME